MCGMSIASVKQSLMNGVAVVHRISCTAIEPSHGRGGTARHSAHVQAAERPKLGQTSHPSRPIAMLVLKACATCAIIGTHIDDDRYQFTAHDNKRKQATASELSTIIGDSVG
jgi:hypothetical protein